MHNHIFCALPSKTFTRTGILCHCFARKYPTHAHEYAFQHAATSSPTSYSFKSITFALLNAALAEGLHCEEENSPHTPVITLHEILPLPQQPPSKIKIKKKKNNPSLSHQGKNTKWESERQSEVPPKNRSSFSKKGPPLGSLPVKPDHEAVFRG